MNDLNIIKEACVGTVIQCLNAEKNGADRLELCGDLSVGGVTPDYAMLAEVMEKCSIPVKVMIRPRGGSFVHTIEEFEQMQQEVIYCKENGVSEVVFGFLTPDNQIDVEKTRTLAELASPMQVTFHKAIDDTIDILAAVDTLKTIPQITGILTSGGCATAQEGISVLKEMKKRCGEQISLIVAGKVTEDNLAFLCKEIGAVEYHGKLIVGSIG
ncbi:MAG: copper homeostasis protein [Saprospiraceae bacterium]|jgi:copper homeostasis protein